MQKMVTKAESLYYTFYHSVGHEDKGYQASDLLQERTYDSYFVKGEDPRTIQQSQPQPQMAQPKPQV